MGFQQERRQRAWLLEIHHRLVWFRGHAGSRFRSHHSAVWWACYFDTYLGLLGNSPKTDLMCLDRPTLHIRGVGLAHITATWKQEHTLVFPPITAQDFGGARLKSAQNCFVLHLAFHWHSTGVFRAFSLLECRSVNVPREHLSHLLKHLLIRASSRQDSLANFLFHRVTDVTVVIFWMWGYKR